LLKDIVNGINDPSQRIDSAIGDINSMWTPLVDSLKIMNLATNPTTIPGGVAITIPNSEIRTVFKSYQRWVTGDFEWKVSPDADLRQALASDQAGA